MIEDLKIFTVPNKVLSRKANKVDIFDDRLIDLIKKMRITQAKNNGIGLSAPQVGYSLRLAVIEFDPKNISQIGENVKNNNILEKIPLTILINPQIIWHSRETEIKEEGCLSLPGIELPVKRYKEIEILNQNQKGKKKKIKAKGVISRIIQHEIDHLNGILITDRAILKN